MRPPVGKRNTAPPGAFPFTEPSEGSAMIVWKVMLQAAVTGAIFGPLAGAAFGPVRMKAPPEPPWRHMLKPAISASSYDYAIAPPQDLGPPEWLDGPARRLGWQSAYEGTSVPLLDYRPARSTDPVPEPEPLPDPLSEPQSPASGGESRVTVHRAAGATVEAVAVSPPAAAEP